MSQPRTFVEAADNLRTAWRALCAEVLASFPPAWRPAVAAAPTRVYRFYKILAYVWFAIITAAFLYAMATGQFDWGAG